MNHEQSITKNALSGQEDTKNARLKVIEESLNSIMTTSGSNNENIESAPAPMVAGQTNVSDMNEQLQIGQVSEETTRGNTQAAVAVDNTNLADDRA